MRQLDTLRQRAEALHLHGLLAHWEEVGAADWVENLVQWEEDGHTRRSLERPLALTKIDPRPLSEIGPLASFS